MSRNTSSKMKVPEVKMTKTARMRLLKANPLIKYQIEKTNNIEMAKNLNLDSVSSITKAIINGTELDTSSWSKENKVKRPVKLEPKKKYPTKNGSGNQKVNKVEPNIGRTEIGKRNLVRRSASAPRLKNSKDIMDTISEEHMNRSISVENISTHITKTPSDKRNSLLVHSFSHVHASPSAPLDLRRRLTDWLEKRNRKHTSFKHLKCFGVHKIDIIQEENKENVDTSRIKREGSYEDLKIENSEYRERELDQTTLVFAPSDLEKIAREAVKDVLCLISEGYPKEQCEAWLKVIRTKCPHVVEDPQYWECRAKVEQLRGDIGSAVECYKTAVVQGAEVSSVEQSLDQLLHKFKLLDIESTDKNKPAKERAKVIQDFKNVFTSMIIKFAIQEKSIKNSKMNKTGHMEPPKASTKLLVTPVRRSTRLSRSMFTSTPGTKICSSIQDLDFEGKEKISFQSNAALLDI